MTFKNSLGPFILAGGFAVMASLAAAHSPLKFTDPAAGDTLAAGPDTIQMVFNGPLRLTRVSLSGAGLEDDLDLSAFGGFIAEYALPVTELAAGDYTIVWRGLGGDGHIQTGEFTFSVN